MDEQQQLEMMQQSAEYNAGPPAIVWVIYIAFIALIIASLWKVFTKAGEPGWAAIVPIYNLVVMMKIVGRPVWWLLLFFIPCVGIIPAIILNIDLAKSFGKGVGFGLGLSFLGFIFMPILAFGDAQYQGPAAATGTGGAATA